jgi:hypothetical protein
MTRGKKNVGKCSALYIINSVRIGNAKARCHIGRTFG